LLFAIRAFSSMFISRLLAKRFPPVSRTLEDFRLNDRAARARLPHREKPYWRLISEGRHIGYRVGKTGASWVVRLRQVGLVDNYIVEKLGTPDDRAEADGVQILNWKQALEKANLWIAAKTACPSETQPLPVVREVVESYIKIQDAKAAARRGRPTRSTASTRMTKHVLKDPTLPSLALDKLSERALRSWVGRVSVRKATTKRRLCADLKAALNQGYLEHRARLSADLVIAIKEGLKVELVDDGAAVSGARENQILSDDAIRRLIDAAFQVDADGDFGRLVVVLAATGARFSQVQRILVRDVQVAQSRILVPPSRKGRGQKAEHYRVQIGADVLQALAPALADRPPDAPLLERWHFARVAVGLWRRDHRGPWLAASEMTKVWKAVLAIAGMENIVPYALRHSSIVRGLRVGLPIRLVAALHDTSVEMIERHYSRWIVDGLEELSAKALIPLLGSEGRGPERDQAIPAAAHPG
jgi:integrase